MSIRTIKYTTKYEDLISRIPGLFAYIELDDKVAIIHGKTKLKGTTVEATDRRAGAAMMLAGMIAEGTTTITNIEHILRGYENIVEKLSNVGASIKIIDD